MDLEKMSVYGMWNFVYWLFGWEHEDDIPIICVNSLAPTKRSINWVMWRIEPLEEDSEDEEEVAERYFYTHY